MPSPLFSRTARRDVARAPRPAAPALLPALVLLTQHPTSNRHGARHGESSRKHPNGAACFYRRRRKPFPTGVEKSLDAAGLGARATLKNEAQHSNGGKCGLDVWQARFNGFPS